MSDKYKMNEPDKAYFLTMTVVGWIDVFTRKNHMLTVVNSLKHCQEHKGLEIFGWCLMPSHLHLIARAAGNQDMPSIVRDFKKFTSRKIVNQIAKSLKAEGNGYFVILNMQENILKESKNISSGRMVTMLKSYIVRHSSIIS